MIEIDLNLLRVFDTLVEVRSVTRAAGRLGLTQSAVSHALARLRSALDDPLFVRAPGGLQPTARALEIAPGVREGLAQLRGALSPTEFIPGTAQRRFTIAAGSYFCTLLVPELIARVRAVAPEVTLRIVSPGPELLSELDEAGVDLALGAFTRVPSRLSSEALYREELVWIAAAGNPIARALFDPRVFAAAPRVTVSVGRPSDALRYDGVLERRLIAETGETEPFAAGGDAGIVYDGITAIGIVARTDMIALVPRRFAERDDPAPGVVTLDAPEEGGIDLMILWHGKSDDDAGLAWLRGLIREIVSAL
jgi:DNA-binding transcriptional LysR family regulator